MRSINLPHRNDMRSFLDRAAQDVRMQQLKARSYAALGPLEGRHVLDVGCGLGDDVRALATLVGPDGSVIGLDHSAYLLEQAREPSHAIWRNCCTRPG